MTTSNQLGELLAMCQEDIPDLRRSGSKWKGKCPFHPDREPSFYVGLHEGREYFKCFGQSCQKSGGAAAYRRLSGRRRLDSNDRPTIVPIIDAPAPDVVPPPGDTVRDMNAFFQNMLLRHTRAQAYLQSRGIAEDHYTRHGLGYCPRGKELFGHMIRNGYQEEQLTRWGLIRPRDRQAVHGGRVTIAHRTPHQPQQDNTWYTARNILSRNDRVPRYLHPVGPRPPLLSPPPPGKTVVLVEGPFDMLTLKILGIRSAAINGTPDDSYFARALQAAGYHKIMALPDRDDAGAAWAENLQTAAHSMNIPFTKLELPPLYADPAQLMQGPDPRGEIRRIISEAIDRSTPVK